MARIRGQTPWIVRALNRTQYLVVTMEGIQFVEEWYTAKHVPTHLTRLYQFLLRLIWMKGTMSTRYARRLGYNNTILKHARLNGYVKVHNRPLRPSEEIQNKIIAIIGKGPRWIYA